MSLNQWYNSIPVVTRVLFTSSFAFTLLPNFGFLAANNLVLSYESAIQGFEVYFYYYAIILLLKQIYNIQSYGGYLPAFSCMD